MMSELDEGWPGSPAYVVLRMNGGAIERVAEHGDLDDVRDWASVSKLAVSMAFGVEMDWDLHSYTEMVGPQGANYANLLSHSSGLGLEEGDPVIPIATRRVYSNYGVELAVSKIVGENSADTLIRVPELPTLLQPLVATVPLQVFACALADAKGLDVDQPRNLAKSVTVE